MKRISPGTVTVAVLAVLFGLVTAYAVRQLLRRPDVSPEPSPEIPMARLLVAKFNLPKYTRIREEYIEVIDVPMASFPDGEFPKDAVRFPAQVLGRLVKAEKIMANQPIMESNLYDIGEVPRLGDQLPPGYRAVTIQVDAGSAVNGMVQPDSYVDVNLTVSGQEPQLGGLATLTLLRGIKVLTTSTSRFPRTEDQPTNVRSITLAVLPKQANKLILAQRYGTLSVTLRSRLDEDAVARDEEDREMINTNDLLGLIPEPEPVVLEQTAQIWKGGSMREVVFDIWDIQEAADATAVSEGREPTPVAPNMPTTKRGCKTCGKKKGAGSGDPLAPTPAPTPAPPQDSSVLPMGSRIERRPSGQVIHVPVETRGA